MRPKGEDPEEDLRRLIDDIEREEAPAPVYEPPAAPSNDEIRAGVFQAPIEGAINPTNPDHRLDKDLDELKLSDIERPRDEQRLAELEREIEEETARHREQAQGIKTEFDGRMRQLEEKLRKVREEREGTKSQEDARIALDNSSSKGLGLGLSIAYTMMGMPLLGIAIGWFLDQSLGTNIWKGILAVVGAAVGLAFTVVSMNRVNRQ
ncbi:MAG: hypothetical protein QOJ65_2784 [Fimbriimonadaceae bacterium]|nr:hypothetical protein [Fimbriimonadaceae bacterium]